MFDWDDLRCFLAVARGGSTLAGARTLGINQSTVARRLAKFEAELGRKLFERTAGGYRLTALGADVLRSAEEVEKSVAAFARRAGAADAIAGTLRITCPEPIVGRLSGSAFMDEFRAEHPEIRVEFVMSDRYLDLAKGEADVALRSGDVDDPGLVGTKVADSVWAVYAARRYADAHGLPASASDMAGHTLIGFDGALRENRAAHWLASVAPGASFAASNTSILGVLHAVKSGIGVAPLPAAIADAEPDLVRAFGPVSELTRSWRLLTPADLRHTPRVAAIFDFMVRNRKQLRAILGG